MTSIENFQLNPLTAKQIPLVLIDRKNEEWFVTNYQSRTQKKSPELYSLRTLVDAVNNSEAEFEQFPVDERNIRDIAKSIFIDSFWMQRDVTLGSLDGKLYIIGGRHRIAAIVNTLAQVLRQKRSCFAWTELHLNEAFDNCLDMFIRCDVLYIGNKEDLLTLVTADNTSRRMRKAEYGHLLSQAYGADSSSLDSISRTLLTSDLSPVEAVKIAAQNFVRRPQAKLKAQTKNILGEKIAKHILYGSDTAKNIAKDTQIKVKSTQEFEKLMDRAWSILQETIKDQIVIAKNANAIAKEVCDKLDHERRMESLIVIPEQKKEPILVEPVTAPPRGSRKMAKV